MAPDRPREMGDGPDASESPAIETLTAADLDGLERTLGEAFADNPSYVAAVRGDKEARVAVAGNVNRSISATALRRGLVLGVREGAGIAAASISYPPGSWPLSFGDWVRSGWGAVQSGMGVSWRLARIDALMRIHHMRTPHWYLFVLGVDPGQQGRGLGSLLLRRLCADADADGVPTFLETDAQRNVPLYARHGFDVLHEGPVPGLEEVILWCMRRDPHQGA